MDEVAAEAEFEAAGQLCCVRGGRERERVRQGGREGEVSSCLSYFLGAFQKKG
jgi:hypothetical protein